VSPSALRRFGTPALIIIGLWTVFGLFSAWITHFRSSFGPMHYSWGSSLFLELTYTSVAAAFTPPVLWLARRYRLDRTHLIRNLIVHLVGTVAFAACSFQAWAFVTGQAAMQYWPHGVFSITKFQQSLVWALENDVPLYWVIVLLDYAIDYYHRYQAGLNRAAILQTQLAQAQLQALKMQLNPHFLFNTLHAISALIHDNPDGAEVMVARLSDLLRLSLDSTQVQEVTLRQELKSLDLYLEIEHTRFEDRLTVRLEIAVETLDALAPNFILQPLVENAIKHGLGNMTSGGSVTIRAERQDKDLVLEVIDNGPGLRDTPRKGVGLTSTRERLERLYGDAQSLTLRNLSTGGLQVRIRLPFKPSTVELSESDRLQQVL
jgi:two-component sensor histidine kinase